MNKLKQHLQLLIFYTSAKLEAESFRHFAGYLWWLLDPLLNVAIYYFLFKVIMNRGENDYIAFLVVGLIVWKWLADAISKSSSSVLANLHILKKIRLNPEIFPTVDLFYCSWKFLVIFSIIVPAIGFLLFGFSLNHFLLIPLLLTTFVFIMGIGFISSSIIPFIPDLGFIITYSLRLVFYGSCVLFSEEKIPANYKWLFHWNPFAVIIKGFRMIMIDLSSPELWYFAYPLTIGLLFIWAGRSILRIKTQEYAKLF